jgi:hypothetical protein
MCFEGRAGRDWFLPTGPEWAETVATAPVEATPKGAWPELAAVTSV